MEKIKIIILKKKIELNHRTPPPIGVSPIHLMSRVVRWVNKSFLQKGIRAQMVFQALFIC